VRRSPTAVGIVLGLLVGAATTVVMAATTSGKAALPGAGMQPDVLYSNRPVSYRVRGLLPRLEGSARAYRLRSTPRPDDVERLARAFAIAGPMAADANGWVVRDGPKLLRVERAAGLRWFVATLDGPCRLVPGERPGPVALPPVAPEGPTDCPDGSATGAPPETTSRAEATRVALDAFRRGGAGPLGQPVVIGAVGTIRVLAEELVDGRPAGLGWMAAISNGAIVQASGYLARPEPADVYPLAGVQTGLRRLRHLPPAGALVRTVTGVRLGLLPRAAWLVPAYLFEFEGGGTEAVPAVEDRYLQ